MVQEVEISMRIALFADVPDCEKIWFGVFSDGYTALVSQRQNARKRSRHGGPALHNQSLSLILPDRALAS